MALSLLSSCRCWLSGSACTARKVKAWVRSQVRVEICILSTNCATLQGHRCHLITNCDYTNRQFKKNEARNFQYLPIIPFWLHGGFESWQHCMEISTVGQLCPNLVSVLELSWRKGVAIGSLNVCNYYWDNCWHGGSEANILMRDTLGPAILPSAERLPTPWT